MIISETPLRISFFGGGSDYPIYYWRAPGAILGVTINKYIRVSLNSIEPFFDHKIRIGYSKTEFVRNVHEIRHPSIRECLIYKDIDKYLDIHIFADLPAKTGLGSSSSFTVGFLKALYAFESKSISKQGLAKEACLIEQVRIGENVGSQDQFHAAFGGFNLIHFSGSDIRVEPVQISEERLQVLESHLLLFYTGITRFASEVVVEQIQKTADKDNDSLLKQMYEMTFQAKDILLHSSSETFVQEFGSLLHESWLLKKQLSKKISNPQIDQAYEACMQEGAYGGKLCGAGNGGFLAIFAPKETHEAICQRLSLMRKVEVRFEHEGSKVIYRTNE